MGSLEMDDKRTSFEAPKNKFAFIHINSICKAESNFDFKSCFLSSLKIETLFTLKLNVASVRKNNIA